VWWCSWQRQGFFHWPTMFGGGSRLAASFLVEGPSEESEQIFANEEVKKTSVSSVVGWWYCENTNFDVFIICRRIWVPFFVVVVEVFRRE